MMIEEEIYPNFDDSGLQNEYYSDMDIKDSEENKTTFYNIEFSINGENDSKITIRRRYSDFDSIQTKLMEELKNFPLPSIPPKDYSVWNSISYLIGGSNDDEMMRIENRKWGFKRWIGKILSNPKMKDSPKFREFLSVENYPLEPKSKWSYFPSIPLSIPFVKTTSPSQLENLEKMVRQLSSISDLFCQSKVNVVKDIPTMEEIHQLVQNDGVFDGTHVEELSSFFLHKSKLFKDHGKKIWTDYILTLKYVLLDLEYVKGKTLEKDDLEWFKQSIEKELKQVLLRLIKYSMNYHLSCSQNIKRALEKMEGDEFSFGVNN